MAAHRKASPPQPERAASQRCSPRRGHGEEEGGGGEGDVGGEAVGRGGASPPQPRRAGGADGRRRGRDGELSPRSCSGGAPAEAGGVYACEVCYRTFDRIKAKHGHMRVHERADEEERERGKKARVERLPEQGQLAGAALSVPLSWRVTGRRGRNRAPAAVHDEEELLEAEPQPAKSSSAGHGKGESAEPPAERARVELPDRASIAAILGDMTGLQVGEEELDQPWAAEMVRGAECLLFLRAGAGGVSLSPVDGHSQLQQAVVAVAVPTANSPEENKAAEPVPTSCNAVLSLESAVVIVADGDADAVPNNAVVGDADAVPNSTVSEINASAMTIESAPDAADLSIATVPDAAALTIVPAAPDAAIVAVAAAPDAAKGNETTHGNDKAGVAAIVVTGAESKEGSERTYRCKLCGKTFQCYQGLGGHMAGHKNSENKLKEQLAENVAAAGTDAGHASGKSSAKRIEGHTCRKCNKPFPTGQALGGHMRLHLVRPNTASSSSLAAPLEQQKKEEEPPEEMAVGGNADAVHVPATASNLPLAFALQNQEEEEQPPEDMAMAANAAVIPVPAAATATSSAATASTLPLAFDLQNLQKQQQQEEPPRETANASNGACSALRLFGVNIAEGPKHDPDPKV